MDESRGGVGEAGQRSRGGERPRAAAAAETALRLRCCRHAAPPACFACLPCPPREGQPTFSAWRGKASAGARQAAMAAAVSATWRERGRGTPSSPRSRLQRGVGRGASGATVSAPSSVQRCSAAPARQGDSPAAAQPGSQAGRVLSTPGPLELLNSLLQLAAQSHRHRRHAHCGVRQRRCKSSAGAASSAGVAGPAAGDAALHGRTRPRQRRAQQGLEPPADPCPHKPARAQRMQGARTDPRPPTHPPVR